MSGSLVALTRWTRGASTYRTSGRVPSVDEESSALAPLLRVESRDLARRLQGPLPRIAVHAPNRETAVELAAVLRSRGHGGVAVERDALVELDAMTHVKSFERTDDELVAHAAGSLSRRVPWKDVRALLEARVPRSAFPAREEGRAAARLSRASVEDVLALAPERRVSRADERGATEDVLVVFMGEDDSPLVFREGSLNYTGLGGAMAFTANANFRTLVSDFRGRARDALFDDRFARRTRTTGASEAPEGPRPAHARWDAEDVVLLAHVLVVAAREGQL
ncbi:MAG: hypothetical protein U0169_11435 [Polyangiaceae bacterium]